MQVASGVRAHKRAERLATKALSSVTTLSHKPLAHGSASRGQRDARGQPAGHRVRVPEAPVLCAGTGSSLHGCEDTHGETPPRAWPQWSRPLPRDGPGTAQALRARDPEAVLGLQGQPGAVSGEERAAESLLERETAGVLSVISFPASLL